MKIQEEGRLERWIEANLKWLHETFGKENVVSCVLHMDEKTPHLHATIVPIVHTERQRREREGEKKYNTKSGPRLSADDVPKRAKLHEYQNTYAAAMSEFGLKRGIVGSTARHIATSTHYKQQMQQPEENIANLQEEVEKTKEEKSTLLAIFGKGDLAKARKELAKLQTQIAELEAEKATLKQKHESDIANRWSSESRSQVYLDYSESWQRKTEGQTEEWLSEGNRCCHQACGNRRAESCREGGCH